MSDEPLGEPVRMCDDPAFAGDALAADLRGAIAAGPLALDLVVGAAALDAAITGAPAGGSPAAGAPAGGSVAATGAWAAGVVAVVLVGVLAWWGTRSALTPDVPDSTPPVDAPLDEPSVADVAPEASEAIGGAQVVPELEEPPAIAPEVDEPPPSRERRRAQRRAPPSVQDLLQQEMQLTSRARTALPNQPARALSLVREGRRRFPEGLFVEEREAIEVLALFALDRERAAMPLGQRFLRAHPSGPFSERVRRAVAAGSTTQQPR